MVAWNIERVITRKTNQTKQRNAWKIGIERAAWSYKCGGSQDANRSGSDEVETIIASCSLEIEKVRSSRAGIGKPQCAQRIKTDVVHGQQRPVIVDPKCDAALRRIDSRRESNMILPDRRGDHERIPAALAIDGDIFDRGEADRRSQAGNIPRVSR